LVLDKKEDGITLIPSKKRILIKELGGYMTVKPFFIRAEWDEEARVWVATSDDVPGLATEEATMEALIEKLKIMLPELLEANGIQIGQEVPFEILTRRFEIAQSVGI
jgi:predicted RNase H-like HicB family nuclease